MKNVYSVSQINTYIKNMFTQDFMLQRILVQGEVSNLKYHSSGHIYFSLKDSKGIIPCVMFAGNRDGLKFRLEDGQQVIAQGNIDIYERDGRYQLYARAIRLSGEGALYAQYEKLKAELADLGMFDEVYKTEIPGYISTLGVVTASTGAAVRDIIQIATRRNPYVQIILYPAIVQGEEAVPSIVKGIKVLEQYKVDVMIVGRGGGSIEDLWAFNSREVAQAIFDCSVPVISAVGHETDFTIADLVADLRAPTPSAGAELAVYEYSKLISDMDAIRNNLNRVMRYRLEAAAGRSERLGLRLGAFSPGSRINELRMRLLRMEEHVRAAMKDSLIEARHRLQLDAGRLEGLSPAAKLGQGFSWVTDADNRNISDVSRVSEGDLLKIFMKNGVLTATVTGRETTGFGD